MLTRSCVAVKELVLFARNYPDSLFFMFIVSLSWSFLAITSILAIMVVIAPTAIEASSVLVPVALSSALVALAVLVVGLVIRRHRMEREFCDDVIYALMTERLDSDL